MPIRYERRKTGARSNISILRQRRALTGVGSAGDILFELNNMKRAEANDPVALREVGKNMSEGITKVHFIILPSQPNWVMQMRTMNYQFCIMMEEVLRRI